MMETPRNTRRDNTSSQSAGFANAWNDLPETLDQPYTSTTQDTTIPSLSSAWCESQASTDVSFIRTKQRTPYDTPQPRRRNNLLTTPRIASLIISSSPQNRQPTSALANTDTRNTLTDSNQPPHCFDNNDDSSQKNSLKTITLAQSSSKRGGCFYFVAQFVRNVVSFLPYRSNSVLFFFPEAKKLSILLIRILLINWVFLSVVLLILMETLLAEFSQGHCWYKTLPCYLPNKQIRASRQSQNDHHTKFFSDDRMFWPLDRCRAAKRPSHAHTYTRIIFCKPTSTISKFLRWTPALIYRHFLPSIFVDVSYTEANDSSTPSTVSNNKPQSFVLPPVRKDTLKTETKADRDNGRRILTEGSQWFIFSALVNFIRQQVVKVKACLTSRYSYQRSVIKPFPRHPRNIILPDSADNIWLSQLSYEIQQFSHSGVLDDRLHATPQSQALRHHSKEFAKRIEKVVENVYVGIGYGLANVVVLQTQLHGELVVIDTLESPLAMREFIQDLRPLLRDSTKNDSRPLNVSCVIYTHFHSDHTFGASEIVTPGVTPIWAHQKTHIEIERVFSLVGGATYKRSMHQFGSFLSEQDGYLNAGIGQRLRYSATPKGDDRLAIIRPTHMWTGTEKKIEVDNEMIYLLFAPGESADQTIVWMPEKRLLMGADNIYKAFPNIYAIRGTPSRDAMQWVRSLDRMRFLFPEYLVLGHTSVVRGKEEIWETITAYRDGIQYIHDQTVRYMNKGYSVNSIVETVRLPGHLEQHPYLQQFYGTVPWAIRAVFQHYVGWFSGRAEDLRPLSITDRAHNIVEIAGGRHALLTKAYEALKSEQYQWSLELATYAQEVAPDCFVARELRTLSLKGLASIEPSAPGRNWYLTEAKVETEKRNGVYKASASPGGGVVSPRLPILGRCRLVLKRCLTKKAASISERLRLSLAQKQQCIDSMPQAADIFHYFSVRIKDDLLTKQDLVIGFQFIDVDIFTCWHVRRGVVYPRSTCERKATFNVTTTDKAWRKIIKGELRPLVAIATGRLRVSTGRANDYWTLKKVMNAIELTME